MTTRQDIKTDYRLLEAALDGELSGPELAELRQRMTTSDELQAVERAILEMRELVRLDAELAADAVDLDGLWARLEPQLTPHAAPLDVLTLQAFADGELAPAEAAAVAARLADFDEDRERLTAIAEMGGLVRARIDAAADTVDFGSLWSHLDAAVGSKIEAEGGLAKAPAGQRPARAGWLDRLVAALGGYRSLFMSAATAVVAVLVMLLVTRGSGSDHGSDTQALEIRVVHINEVRSSPGYNVTVDQPIGSAPVIFIRPSDSAPESQPAQPPEQNNGRLFDNPI